jgi:Na+/melibiose symporter-like transporter
VPLGAIVIAVGLRALPADVRRVGPRYFDLTGALLVTGGLVGLTYGIVRTDTLGWGSPGVLIPLVAAIGLLAAFAYVEARVSEAPLVPLSIFRLSTLRAANIVVVLMYSALFSMFFFVTLYLQQVLGQDALEAGLSFLPITLSVFIASSLAPRLVARFGVRPVVTAGMLLATAGLAILTAVKPGGSYVSIVLPGGVLAGLGMGLGLVPSTIAATQGVPRHQAGLASGLLNTSRLVGGALGLAVLSTLATASSHVTAGVSGPEALTNGFTVAFQVGAAICLTAALVAAFLLRPAQSPEESEVVEATEREAVAA